jgi:hypothetical protein
MVKENKTTKKKMLSFFQEVWAGEECNCSLYYPYLNQLLQTTMQC